MRVGWFALPPVGRTVAVYLLGGDESGNFETYGLQSFVAGKTARLAAAGPAASRIVSICSVSRPAVKRPEQSRNKE